MILRKESRNCIFVLSLFIGLLQIFHVRPTLADNDGYAPWVGVSLDGRPCRGKGTGSFGPYDYRVRKDKLTVVERYHLNADVLQLRRGMNSADPMGDIAYVVLRFPNHHRALDAAVRYAANNRDTLALKDNPVECMLQRAAQFTPSDPVPRLLFGMFFHRMDELELAEKQYALAEKLAPGEANIAYNQGLLYVELKNYERAAEYARIAYAAGITLPGLRRQLEQVGEWQDLAEDS